LLNQTIDLSEITSGSYLLHLQGQNIFSTFRLVKIN